MGTAITCRAKTAETAPENPRHPSGPSCRRPSRAAAVRAPPDPPASARCLPAGRIVPAVEPKLATPSRSSRTAARYRAAACAPASARSQARARWLPPSKRGSPKRQRCRDGGSGIDDLMRPDQGRSGRSSSSSSLLEHQPPALLEGIEVLAPAMSAAPRRRPRSGSRPARRRPAARRRTARRVSGCRPSRSAIFSTVSPSLSA